MLAASASLPQRYILRALCAEFLNPCKGLSTCSSDRAPLSTTHMCVPKQMRPAVPEWQISQIFQYPLIIETFPRTTSSCPLQVSEISLVFSILPSTRSAFLTPLLFYRLLQRVFLTPSLQRDQTLSVSPNCTSLEDLSGRHRLLYKGPPSK